MNTWTCPRCKVIQRLDEIRTIEILESGKEARVEYHGKIRARSAEGLAVHYACLVCGNVWSDGVPDDDPTPPGGAAVSFLHPIYESGDGDFDALTEWGRERDAC